MNYRLLKWNKFLDFGIDWTFPTDKMDAEINSTMSQVDKILETETLGGILVWHALFIICSAILTICANNFSLNIN